MATIPRHSKSSWVTKIILIVFLEIALLIFTTFTTDEGSKLDQFFDKITIKNVKKEDEGDDDSENQIVWQDDDYIRPIKDIASAEWEETV